MPQKSTILRLIDYIADKVSDETTTSQPKIASVFVETTFLSKQKPCKTQGMHIAG